MTAPFPASNRPTLHREGQYAAKLLRSAKRAHAAGVALRFAERNPELAQRFESKFFGDQRVHAEGLIDHLAVALECDRPALFEAQVGWLKSAFAAQQVPVEVLRGTLQALREEVIEELPTEPGRRAASLCEPGLAGFDAVPSALMNHISADKPHARLAQAYLLAVLEGRREDAIELALKALDDGLSVQDLYRHVLSAAQIDVGRMWQRGELHVAEEHMASRATEQVLALVGARLRRVPRLGKRILVTSSNGDLHDIGLKMVAQHLEMAGFDVVFLGASTPGDDVVRAIEDFGVDGLAVAAKLTLHIPACIELIQTVRNSMRGQDLPILVGGAPFVAVPDLWKVVGADAAATHASDAVPAMKMLLHVS
jgi:methanogenic corrinoid protein MtbC1